MISKVILISEINKIAGTGHLNRCNILIKSLFPKAKKYFYSTKKINFQNNKLFDIFDRKIENVSYLNIINECIGQSKIEKIFVIIDVYNFPDALAKKLYNYGIIFLQYDNFKIKKVYCSFLINLNPSAKKSWYKKKIKNKNCKFFLGYKYFLYRKSFLKNKKKIVRKKIKNILLCFGGSDFLEKHQKFVFFIIKLLKNSHFLHIFVSKNFNFMKNNLLNNKNIKFYFQEDISKHLCKMDLAIISSSSLLYECKFNGIPCLIYSISENQKIFAREMKKDKIIYFYSIFHNYQKYKNKIKNFLNLQYSIRKKIFEQNIKLQKPNKILKKINV
ncbi:MAG: hypothetical protein ACJZ8F_04260 [Candidatus Pelagibacter sp.]